MDTTHVKDQCAIDKEPQFVVTTDIERCARAMNETQVCMTRKVGSYSTTLFSAGIEIVVVVVVKRIRVQIESRSAWIEIALLIIETVTRVIEPIVKVLRVTDTLCPVAQIGVIHHRRTVVEV